MNEIQKLQKARIQEWLAKPEHTDEKDIIEGARMALQCNRNQAMFNTILRRPSRYVSKIRYELEKHLKYMADGLTLDEVRSLDREVTAMLEPVVKEVESTTDKLKAAMDEVPEDSILPSPDPSPADTSKKEAVIARGRRGDHDQLPQEIQDIWPRNAERWKKIKQAFETCKSLDMACDRYEWLKVLKETWYAYKADMAKYDAYVIGEETKEEDQAETVQLSAEDVKAIAAARPYISKNLQKLLDLVSRTILPDFSEKERAEMESWRGRIQQRVDVLLRTNQNISDDLKNLLLEGGIKLDTDTDGQGQKSEPDTETAQ